MQIKFLEVGIREFTYLLKIGTCSFPSTWRDVTVTKSRFVFLFIHSVGWLVGQGQARLDKIGNDDGKGKLFLFPSRFDYNKEEEWEIRNEWMSDKSKQSLVFQFTAVFEEIINRITIWLISECPLHNGG